MNSQDLMDNDNNRAEAIRIIQAFCDEHGFSYSYTQKNFRIALPNIEPLPTLNELRPALRRNTNTDQPSWTLEPDPMNVDELPPIDDTLNEGETPPETEPKG